tara:strand:- start:1090 stop:1413 length:324 start_codon:yes stop_codon:yes gene_type:complete
MKLIKLTQRIINLEGDQIVSVYVNIEYISMIEEYCQRDIDQHKNRTGITLNSAVTIEVCEDIEEVIRRIHLQTIKWKDGQFFINGEPQELTYTYEQGLKITTNQIGE